MRPRITNPNLLRSGTRWPVSLPSAARRLGCTAPHLCFVLRGIRTSPKLKARYEALAAELKGDKS